MQAALQTMSDVMRRELVTVGIDVITLELGELLRGSCYLAVRLDPSAHEIRRLTTRIGQNGNDGTSEGL